MDDKETTRLALRPRSYVVLVYRSPVVRPKKELTYVVSIIPLAVFTLTGIMGKEGLKLINRDVL